MSKDKIFPSPLLIFGDPYLSKNYVLDLKNKFEDRKWVTLSVDKASLSSIRMEVGSIGWISTEKVVVIESFPNKKAVRDFIIDIANNHAPEVGVVILDSNGVIKIDPSNNSVDQTWHTFINNFKSIDGSKIVNNGASIDEKDGTSGISFVRNNFENYNKKISVENAKLMLDIVGYDKGLLLSDIEKMAIIAPEIITADFIVEHAFPTSKESILYKLGNVLDTCSYSDTIDLVDRLLKSGFHYNVLAEYILKKARWQMVISYWWLKGVGWDKIRTELMQMGGFPSCLWHGSDCSNPEKKKIEISFGSIEEKQDFFIKKKGLRDWHFKNVPKKPKKKRGRKSKQEQEETTTVKAPSKEYISHPYVAKCLVDFFINKIAKPNSTDPEVRQKAFNRAFKVYMEIQESFFEMRTKKEPIQDLYHICRMMCDTHLI